MNINTPNNKKFVSKLICSILYAVIILFIFNSPSLAITAGSIGAGPTRYSEKDPRTRSWFIYTYSPGEVRNDSVTVENLGTEQVTLKVYPADSTTTSDGTFTLKAEGDEKNSVGSWIKMSSSLVTLAPNEKKDITFTVSVPPNTPPGDYSGGIIFENTRPNVQQNKNRTVNIISRIGVRIYASVPGAEQLNLEVKNFKYTVVDNKLHFSFTADNKGVVNIKPYGMLQIKDILGKTIASIPLNDQFDIITPGDEPVLINIPTNLDVPLLNRYTANLAVYYSPTKSAVASISFMPNPWSMYIVVFIMLLLIVLIAGHKYILITTPKTHKTHLAPHVKIIVGAIILGVLGFSILISLLLNTII